MNRITPEYIGVLNENEIFVFGSNEAGIHGAGAALIAHQKFGAILGRGVGLCGNSYAIPTKDKNIETLPLDDIKDYVWDFSYVALYRPELTFYVTKIGCGLAGYTPANIAPMFERCVELENVYLPEEFIEIITKL